MLTSYRSPWRPAAYRPTSVDTETFYTTRVESAAGEAVFLDYRLFEGHPAPQVIKMMGAMGEQTVYVEGVEFGVELADSMFRMQ